MFDLYDSGVPQEVEAFWPIERGSRIVLLVDNSLNLKAEPAALARAATAIIEELYEDDQMMVVGYSESAEIIEDMTADLGKLREAPSKFTRNGFPRLFDAVMAVADALAASPLEKRAIVLISDGYDSDSKTKFDDVLETLQEENILVYALEVQDRTRGALLREKPKPSIVIEKLTAGTGGAAFPFDKAAEAAKLITDELRNRWYRLTYTPSGVNMIGKRNLLIMSREPGIELRTKSAHPGRYRGH
jgi:VWFA-related protein